MGKDPAFLFYPGDWLGGTMGMTFEQKGCYIDLLMMQFNCGKFTIQQAKQLLSICFDNAWPVLQHKFILQDGLYFNDRLFEETEKRKSYIESRRSSGLAPKKKKAYAEHTLKRTEDENENVIDYESIIENYHVLCPKMNKVQAINDNRKGFINARVSEFGISKVTEVIRIAGESSFLNGSNDKAWKADFEWMMRPTNFIKIMENKYQNKTEKKMMI